GDTPARHLACRPAGSVRADRPAGTEWRRTGLGRGARLHPILRLCPHVSRSGTAVTAAAYLQCDVVGVWLARGPLYRPARLCPSAIRTHTSRSSSRTSVTPGATGTMR